MANSIIVALRDFVAGCEHLQPTAPLYVDLIGGDVSYAIVPLPNSKVIETYLNGGTLREYTFAFQFCNLTADDAIRIENSAFNEKFSEWLDAQTLDGDLPILPTGATSEAVEATQNGFLYQQGESESAIYQINCRLIYEQSAAEE